MNIRIVKKTGDISDIKLGNEHTFVVTHKKKIVSLSTCTYDNKNEALYYEISCTRQNDECVIGTNYFIGAYMILELLKKKKLKKIWGRLGGDIKKLTEYHKKRGCSVDDDEYNCEIVEYLNIFFQTIRKFKLPAKCKDEEKDIKQYIK